MTDTYEDKFKKLVESKVSPDDEVYRGTMSPKTLKELGMKKMYEDVMKWGEQSRQGLLCGIFGCTADPSSPCPICHCGYCPEHIRMHFHAASNDGIFVEKYKIG